MKFLLAVIATVTLFADNVVPLDQVAPSAYRNSNIFSYTTGKHLKATHMDEDIQRSSDSEPSDDNTNIGRCNCNRNRFWNPLFASSRDQTNELLAEIFKNNKDSKVQCSVTTSDSDESSGLQLGIGELKEIITMMNQGNSERDIDFSIKRDSTITNSVYHNSIILRSTLTDSTVLDSTVIDSTLTSSRITGGSRVESTTTTGSTINNSILRTSTLTGSTIQRCTITASTITNSRFTDRTITSSTFTDYN